MQLDATLQSLRMHCEDPQSLDLKVLFKASTDRHAQAYQRLGQAYPDWEFLPEGDFRSQVIAILERYQYVLFLVDDNIFVRAFALRPIRNILESTEEALGYSLRLGTNTTHCYPVDAPQHLPEFKPRDDATLQFNWTVGDRDFGYPLEVSSSLYRTRDILGLLSGRSFSNPNTLEDALAGSKDRFAGCKAFLLCGLKSTTFCNPVNLTQSQYANRVGARGDHSVEALNELFLGGHRIDVRAYEGFVPRGCHQEVPMAVVAPSGSGSGEPSGVSSRPTVSIVIPCYNYGRYLSDAVGSVLGQTYQNFEIIIVDDGSTDDSVSVARQLIAAHPGHSIRLIAQPNSGHPGYTRNRGILSARGRYILPLDADDMLAPTMLAQCVDYLERNPQVGIVYTDREDFGESSQTVRAGEYDFARLRYANLLSYCALFRREVWAAVGGYRADVGFEDWDFWVAAGARGYFGARIAAPLFRYRVHGGGRYQSDLAKLEESMARIVITNKEAYGEGEVAEAERRLNGVAGTSPSHAPTPERDGVRPSGPVPRDGKASPLVSVILPTYNRPELLSDALQSALGQTYSPIEVIVVNDAGTDVEGLVRWLGRDADVTYIRHGRNRGLAAARNTALRVARGDVIVYLDDDDLFLPEHVSTIVKALNEGHGAFVYTDADYVLERLENGKRLEQSRARPYDGVEYSKERLHVHNFIPVNCWAHRRSALAQVGYFDESLDNHEDWEFLLRFARQHDFRHVPKTTVEVHQRVNQKDNMLRRESGKFLDTYRRIYQQYPMPDNVEVSRGRAQILARLAGGGADQAQPELDLETDPIQAVRKQAYASWVKRHALREIDGQLFAERMVLKWTRRPTVVLVMCLRAGEESLLADTIDSLAGQLYDNWRLVVVADFPSPGAVFDQIPLLKWVRGAPEDGLAAAVSAAFEGLSGHWVGLVAPGIRLEPHMLFACVDYINVRPDWRFIYTDHDVAGSFGERTNPLFKPDFNLDMLRATPYMGDVCLVRGDVFGDAASEPLLADARAYDLALRVLDRSGETAIGHIAEILYHAPEGAPGAGEDAARRAVVTHLERNGLDAEVQAGLLPLTHRVVYRHKDQPLVSIIVPTKDKLEFLEPCVESVVGKTTYPNYELIVVDNQSEDPDVLAYFSALEARPGGRVRVVKYDHPFNFSAICNAAAQVSRGDYLLLLNNDTQVLQGEWLDRMMSHAQRPEVGVVGARLIYPENGKIQHAGVVLGLAGVAEHAGAEEALGSAGYMKRLQIDQNFSAVTGACLLTRKGLYDTLGGLDAEHLRNRYNDVDYCLKVREAGYKIVWTPYATLVHHESITQKTDLQDIAQQARHLLQYQEEQNVMYDKWLPRLAHDPAYNRHLSLVYRDWRTEADAVLNWDPHFHDRPRIYGIPLPGGSGDYRVIQPFRALSKAGLAQCEHVRMANRVTRVLTLTELARLAPDTLVVHAALDDAQIAALEAYRRCVKDMLTVYALDDLVTLVPKKSNVYREYMKGFRDAKPRLRRGLRSCDRLVVSTEPLANFADGLIPDIRIVPNRLERDKWIHLTSARGAGRRPRVGWAGAQQHQGDLEIIEPVVEALAGEVEWVFMGMATDRIRPHLTEFHEGVPIHAYPDALARLNLDVAIAPLEVHPFNEAKSNLRLLEYGILGWPVVCTDIFPYRTNEAPVTRVTNDADAWIEAIRAHVRDPEGAARRGDALREWVLTHYMLEDSLDEWFQALVKARP
ncbi:MAG: glycosyltransferase [Betaproteobacteria bacterium]|nr:glycosyltransferase [Betaproteobacteria bacterium]